MDIFRRVLLISTIFILLNCNSKNEDNKGKNIYDNKYDAKPVNDKYNGMYKGVYEDGKTKYEGTYVNGIKNGKFITYFPSGKIEKIENYVNDTLQGEFKWIPFEDLSSVTECIYIDGVYVRQITYNQITGDTLNFFENHVAYIYNNSRLIKRIINSTDSTNIKVLEINNDSIFVNIIPIIFLTNKDSAVLFKAYSNWEKM